MPRSRPPSARYRVPSSQLALVSGNSMRACRAPEACLSQGCSEALIRIMRAFTNAVTAMDLQQRGKRPHFAPDLDGNHLRGPGEHDPAHGQSLVPRHAFLGGEGPECGSEDDEAREQRQRHARALKAPFEGQPGAVAWDGHGIVL